MSNGRTPDFMLVGAAKAGTTTLHFKLKNHPNILLTDPKEPMYFSNPEVYARGPEWYSSLFKDAKASQLCGDCSTTYMRYPFAEEPNTRNPWPTISQLDKTPKFIYILRHPVDRAYSHYVHHMRFGCTMTFEEAMDRNPIYVNCSKYSLQMSAFREHLPDAKLLALDFTQLIHDRTSATYKTLDFLELPAILPPDPHHSMMNRRDNREFFSKIMWKVPGWKIARKMISPSIKRKAMDLTMNSRLGKRIARKTEVQPMKPETRMKLVEMFEPDIQAAEELLGKPLPDWRA